MLSFFFVLLVFWNKLFFSKFLACFIYLCTVSVVLGAPLVDCDRDDRAEAVGPGGDGDWTAHGGDLLHGVPLDAKDLRLVNAGSGHHWF